VRRTILSLTLPALLLAGASHASAGGFDLRLGAFFPRGHESLFADLNSLYTPIGTGTLRGVEPKDFIGVYGGGEFNSVVAHNLELGISFDAYGNSVETSYRDYTRPDGSEIQQHLHLSTYPLGLTIRFLPTDKSAHVVPFIGGGVDAIFYQYEETGDFIDFFDPTLPVIPDHFRDHSTAFGVHAVGGVRWYLNRDFAIVLEGRYQWAQKDMEEDFAPNPESGLVNRIDLSGASATLGVHVRF
jgi:hypothetical protein